MNTEGNRLVLLRLLQAEETVIKRINTKRPTKLLAEYAQSLLRAMRQLSESVEMCEMDPFWELIFQSTESGALALLKQIGSTIGGQEKDLMESLLLSFYTYLVEVGCSEASPLLCMEEILKSHPQLQLNVSSPEARLLTSNHSREQLIWDLCKSCGFEHDSGRKLFNCGSWAQQDTDANHDVDCSFESSPILNSPAGSAILLSKNIDRSDVLQQLDWTDSALHNQCRLMLVELCTKQSPNLSTLDACLHLCAKCQSPVRPESSEDYTLVVDDLVYVQALSAISATCGNPKIRTVAHYLVRDVLEDCEERFRYAFYLDTFKDCPYKTLKIVTIGMLKDELAGSSPFWWDPAILSELISAMNMVEIDGGALSISQELLAQYCMQAVNFVIFLLQQARTTPPMISLAKTLLYGIRKSLLESFQATDFEYTMVEFQLERATELLGVEDTR